MVKRTILPPTVVPAEGVSIWVSGYPGMMERVEHDVTKAMLLVHDDGEWVMRNLGCKHSDIEAVISALQRYLSQPEVTAATAATKIMPLSTSKPEEFDPPAPMKVVMPAAPKGTPL